MIPKQTNIEQLKKEDFITKTMSIPFVENVPESASEQIYKIISVSLKMKI